MAQVRPDAGENDGIDDGGYQEFKGVWESAEGKYPNEFDIDARLGQSCSERGAGQQKRETAGDTEHEHPEYRPLEVNFERFGQCMFLRAGIHA